jgi:hypothetical protein
MIRALLRIIGYSIILSMLLAPFWEFGFEFVISVSLTIAFILDTMEKL